MDRLESKIESVDSGWSPQCEEFPSLENEWAVLKTTAVVWEGFDENANKKLPLKLKPRPELQVSKNDILITRAGPTSRVGVTVHVNQVRSKLMLSDKLIRLKINKRCSSLFVSMLLGNSNAQQQLISKSSGLAESQTNISQKILLNIRLTFPTLLEQQKIAAFLAMVDEKIRNLKRKINLLEQYKKGMMQKIFSQEVRFKDEDGRDFGEWEEKKLDDMCFFFRGSAISKSDLTEGGINSCIHYGELFTIYKEVILEVMSRTNIDGFRSQVGDILMPSSDVTPLGLAKASSIQLENIILGGDMNILRPKHVDSVFLSYLLNYSYFKIIQIVSGTTVKHIYNKDLKGLEFTLPKEIKEQTKIANFLSAIDDKIALVGKEIAGMENWKKGLLGEMFV